VGRFRGAHVQFHAKLKKPIMTKRSSVIAAKSPTPDSPPLVSGISTPHAPRSPPPTHPRLTHAVPVRTSPDSGSGFSPRLPSSESPGLERLLDAVSGDISIPISSTVSSTSSLVGESWKTFSRSHASISTASDSVLATPSHPVPPHVQANHYVDGSEERLSVTSEFYKRSHEVQRVDVAEPFPVSISQPMPEDWTLLSLHEHTYDDSERSKRLSGATSDCGVGIGLSLLQDLINGAEGEDWSSEEGDDLYISMPNTKLPALPGSVEVDNSRQPTALPSTSDLPDSRSRSSSFSISSPTSNQQSISDWEGASDIYDDYRYSRQSIASRISRFSQTSVHTTHSAPKAPPLPTDSREAVEPKQSNDAIRSGLGQPSVSSASPKASVSPLSTIHSNHPPDLPFSAIHPKDRPAIGHAESSPLIQAAFASVTSFPPAVTGAASTLRQRLENERGGLSHLPNIITHQPVDAGRRGQCIVIEDDEVEQSSHHPPGNLETTQETASSSSGSPSSEIGLAQFPNPLVIANSTPPPSPPKPITSPTITPREEGIVDVSVPALAAPSPIQPFPAPSRDLSHLANTAQAESGSSRRSLFLPHPNAPKPTASPSGSMYARRVSMQTQPPLQTPSSSVIQILIIAGQRGRSGLTSAPTIYGKCEQNLATSTGPVPISFSIDPPPAAQDQGQSKSKAPRPFRRPATVSAITAPTERADHASTQPNVSSQTRRFASISSVTSNIAARTLNSTPGPDPVPSTDPLSDAAGSSRNVISRANFVPKVQTSRPRSRSFSSFDTATGGIANSAEAQSVFN
jgi:hypothetical protein